jgi:hypothetical protein
VNAGRPTRPCTSRATTPWTADHGSRAGRRRYRCPGQRHRSGPRANRHARPSHRCRREQGGHTCATSLSSGPDNPARSSTPSHMCPRSQRHQRADHARQRRQDSTVVPNRPATTGRITDARSDFHDGRSAANRQLACRTASSGPKEVEQDFSWRRWSIETPVMVRTHCHEIEAGMTGAGRPASSFARHHQAQTQSRKHCAVAVFHGRRSGTDYPRAISSGGPSETRRRASHVVSFRLRGAVGTTVEPSKAVASGLASIRCRRGAERSESPWIFQNSNS